jgi:hypothetical protein
VASLDSECEDCSIRHGPGATTSQSGAQTEAECVCGAGHFNKSNGVVSCEHEVLLGGDSRAYEANLASTYTCVTCPDCVICEMGDQVVPKAGYWTFRPDQLEPELVTPTIGRQMFACTNPAGCTCGNNVSSVGDADKEKRGCAGVRRGDCKHGYHGIACGECDRELGFGRYGKLCVECASFLMTSLVLCLGMMVVGLLIFAKMKASKSTDEGRTKSRMIPLFFAYLQVTWCVGAFKLRWPELVAKFFASAGVATASQLSFLDCWVPTNYYHEFALACCIPICAMVAPVVSYVKDVETFHESRAVLFFLVIVVMIHPSVAKLALEMFNCTQFEHELRLELDTSIDCLHSDHTAFQIAASAALLLFTFGLPFSLFLYLFSRRNELAQTTSGQTDPSKHYRVNIQQFGFLYAGFKPSEWFWENVVMARKVFIVAITVFLRRNVFDQTYVALFVIYVSLMLQFRYNPFSSRLHNGAEYLSLITTVITLNGGIAGYGGAIASNDAANEILGWVLLLINIFTTVVLITIIVFEQFNKAVRKYERWQEKRKTKKLALLEKYEDKPSGPMRSSLGQDSAVEEHDLSQKLSKEAIRLSNELIEACEDNPDQFYTLAELFIEAHGIFAPATAEQLETTAETDIVETADLIDNMSTADAIVSKISPAAPSPPSAQSWSSANTSGKVHLVKCRWFAQTWFSNVFCARLRTCRLQLKRQVCWTPFRRQQPSKI